MTVSTGSTTLEAGRVQARSAIAATRRLERSPANYALAALSGATSMLPPPAQYFGLDDPELEANRDLHAELHRA